jgi:hypothetical protein
VVVRVAADLVPDPPPPNDKAPPADKLDQWRHFPLTNAAPLPTGLPVGADKECGGCGGSGKVVAYLCPECDGQGDVEWMGDYSMHTYSDECDFCDGSGSISSADAQRIGRSGGEPSECEDCHGTGRVPSEDGVDVGGKRFGASRVATIASLPDVRFAVQGDESWPWLLFTAGDIEGMLVGMA